MVLPPWLITKTELGKKAVISAIGQHIYNDSINYDDLAAFCNISNDSNIDSQIKELQQKYLDHKKKSLSTDQQQKEMKKPDKPQKKETRGRKNRGLTEKHYKEKLEIDRTFRSIKQNNTFNDVIIEKLDGEIVNDNDLNQYEELTKLTFDSVYDDFSANNPDLIKKHPYNYYKKLLIELKKQLPKITANDIDKCVILWDILKSFMNTIGLYMTWGVFEQLTSIYKYQLEKRVELSPKYADFLQKISKDCDTALINELEYNPYNQTNKIFLAKVRGYIEKTEPKQIEVHHDIRDFNSLPMFKEEK